LKNTRCPLCPCFTQGFAIEGSSPKGQALGHYRHRGKEEQGRQDDCTEVALGLPELKDPMVEGADGQDYTLPGICRMIPSRSYPNLQNSIAQKKVIHMQNRFFLRSAKGLQTCFRSNLRVKGGRHWQLYFVEFLGVNRFTVCSSLTKANVLVWILIFFHFSHCWTGEYFQLLLNLFHCFLMLICPHRKL